MPSLSLFYAVVAIVATFDSVDSFCVTQPPDCLRKSALFAAGRRLSASSRERRDEEKRRQERAEDVIIGKTSAVDGVKDYALDPTATEQEYLRQATNVEQAVFHKTDKGMQQLKMLQVEEAAEAFDEVFQLKPDAYLWQAGIAKFYLGELEDAADIFSRSAAIYESKFFEPATEERIWRYACELKLLSGMSKKERAALAKTGGLELPPLPEKDTTTELLNSEMRKVVRIARELFEATANNEEVNVILGRAKLRAIGGAFQQNPAIDRKMWKLNSWYYLGLYYDVIGEAKESKECMKMALKLCPSAGNGSDIVHTLPMLHMSRRDWFDDEELEEDINDTSDVASTVATASSLTSSPDPLFVETIRSGLNRMRHADLKDALRVRGLRVIGSKEELVERLFKSVMLDAGFTAN